MVGADTHPFTNITLALFDGAELLFEHDATPTPIAAINNTEHIFFIIIILKFYQYSQK